jgi:hypothetical protein
VVMPLPAVADAFVFSTGAAENRLNIPPGYPRCW